MLIPHVHHAVSVKHLSYFDFYRSNRSTWEPIEKHARRSPPGLCFMMALRKILLLADRKVAAINRLASSHGNCFPCLLRWLDCQPAAVESNLLGRIALRPGFRAKLLPLTRPGLKGFQGLKFVFHDSPPPVHLLCRRSLRESP